MTRTPCWFLAVLAAACGDVNADVVFTRNPEPSGAVAPRSDNTAGDQPESDAGGRNDRGSGRVECKIDEDCTRGENPKCVAGQCVR